MDVSLLTIDNIVPANTTAAVSPRPSPPPDNDWSDRPVADNSAAIDTAPPTTTDNNPGDTQNKPAEKATDDFDDTLNEKIASQTTDKPAEGTKPQDQGQTCETTEGENSPETQPAQGTPANGDNETTGIGAQISSIAQLIGKTELVAKPAGLTVAAEAHKLVADSPRPGGTAVEKLYALSQSEKGSNQPSQTQTGAKTILPEAAADSTTDNVQPQQGKTAQTDQLLNTPVIGEKDLSSQQSTEKLMPKNSADTDGKTTSAATDNQKTSTLNGKSSKIDGQIDVSPQKPSAEKAIDENSSNVETQTGNTEPKIAVSSQKPSAEKAIDENSSNNAEPKTTVNPANPTPTSEKTDISQQNQTSQQGTSEALSDAKQSQPANNNIQDTPILQKSGSQQAQPAGGQTRDSGNSTSNDNSKSDFEQILYGNNAEGPTEQTSSPTQVSRPAGNTSFNEVSASIGKQIQESVEASLRQGDQQVTIRLNPPELGRVLIRFQEQQDQITGFLEVSKSQTRYEIEQALPQIIRNLQDAGVQIKRIEVVVSEQSLQQNFKDQSLATGQDSWTGRQDATNHGSSSPGSSVNVNEWLTGFKSYNAAAEPQEMLVTNNSINMLV